MYFDSFENTGTIIFIIPGIDGKESNFIVHHFVDWHCFYVVTT
jgi:hypothetical protein